MSDTGWYKQTPVMDCSPGVGPEGNQWSLKQVKVYWHWRLRIQSCIPYLL
jgi:hypothetical protein